MCLFFSVHVQKCRTAPSKSDAPSRVSQANMPPQLHPVQYDSAWAGLLQARAPPVGVPRGQMSLHRQCTICAALTCALQISSAWWSHNNQWIPRVIWVQTGFIKFDSPCNKFGSYDLCDPAWGGCEILNNIIFSLYWRFLYFFCNILI